MTQPRRQETYPPYGVGSSPSPPQQFQASSSSPPYRPAVTESYQVTEGSSPPYQSAIAHENWEVKGKFPPGLKPILGQVALKAVILGEYDDNFFNYMPDIFPYNRFTMSVSLLSHRQHVRS